MIDPRDALDPAAAFNRDCYCQTLQPDVLARELGADQDPALRAALLERPHLFSGSPVFVSEADRLRMAAVIGAVESVIALPAYREAVMEWARPIHRFAPGPAGAFLGYDFHLGPSGPQLIEINTNAGGGLLNVRLARAQLACCNSVVGPPGLAQVEDRYVAMFEQEWRRQRGEAPLRTIAIVDDQPSTQYLFPEFLLFQRLFASRGLKAYIVDAVTLTGNDEGVWYEGERIDLVYNRITDFALSDPTHAVLRDAYLAGRVVLTPHPRAHALYADKRNLSLLTDETALRGWGVPGETMALLLGGIPRTVRVRTHDAERLWAERRRWFFKPASGYGSKAAYRGDKLTTRVFGEIVAGDYVAQAVVPPTERQIAGGSLKVDLRNYVYDGDVQLLAARLYQGQTTNMRTAGGGFAPVLQPASTRVCPL
jgi:hypothetical protein